MKLALIIVVVVAVGVAAAVAYSSLRSDDDVAAIQKYAGSIVNMHCSKHEGMTFRYADGYSERTVWRCGDGEMGPCFTVSNGFVARVDDFSGAERIGCSAVA